MGMARELESSRVVVRARRVGDFILVVGWLVRRLGCWEGLRSQTVVESECCCGRVAAIFMSLDGLSATCFASRLILLDPWSSGYPRLGKL